MKALSKRGVSPQNSALERIFTCNRLFSNQKKETPPGFHTRDYKAAPAFINRGTHPQTSSSIRRRPSFCAWTRQQTVIIPSAGRRGGALSITEVLVMIRPGPSAAVPDWRKQLKRGLELRMLDRKRRRRSLDTELKHSAAPSSAGSSGPEDLGELGGIRLNFTVDRRSMSPPFRNKTLRLVSSGKKMALISCFC